MKTVIFAALGLLLVIAGYSQRGNTGNVICHKDTGNATMGYALRIADSMQVMPVFDTVPVLLQYSDTARPNSPVLWMRAYNVRHNVTEYFTDGTQVRGYRHVKYLTGKKKPLPATYCVWQRIDQPTATSVEFVTQNYPEAKEQPADQVKRKARPRIIPTFQRTYAELYNPALTTAARLPTFQMVFTLSIPLTL